MASLAPSTNVSETITMDTNKSVGAVFERDPHTLTLSVTGNGTASTDGGTITSGTGDSAPPTATINYVYGDVVNLTAAANTGWHFVQLGWRSGTQHQRFRSITMDTDIGGSGIRAGSAHPDAVGNR